MTSQNAQNHLPLECAARNAPYYREISGKEAKSIAARFWDIWKYDTTYWYPLKDMPNDDKFFIAPKWIVTHIDEIRQLLHLPQEHIYEYGEGLRTPFRCAETNVFWDLSGLETAYCPKDFAWIIYFSHENTVTFAGTIVPRIKEILHAEQECWNRWE